MPIPLITAEIMAKAKTCDNGWSFLELSGVKSQAAKNGNSTNTFFEFTALSGPGNSNDNTGRSATFMVNSSALEYGIAEVIAPYMQLLCALLEVSQDELIGLEVNEEKLLGLKVWADIGEKPVDGKLQKEFKCFSPASAIPF